MAENQPLSIRMFGDFTLSYNDQTIADQHSRSGKLWTVLAYIVTFRERELPQPEIIELLWPEEDDITAPANTLKTLLHRARSLLAMLGEESLRNAIYYHRGYYRWAPDIPFTVDTDDFERFCKLAEAEEDSSIKLEYLIAAIDLYKGDFLPRSSMEAWVMPIQAYYRNLYTKIVYEAIDRLNAIGDFPKVLEICQNAVVINPYDEGLHLHMIKALLATGAQRAALQHYTYVTDLFFTQFGVSPSEELTAVYRDVVQTDRNMELDLTIIKESLQEDFPDKRAYCCEYEFFKDFYRLTARSIARTGQVIHIALITLSSNATNPLTKKQFNVAMDRLQDIVGNCLRRSDIFSRYSLSQYLIMLPSASFENSQMVLNRIVSAFRSQYPKTAATLQYKILPLDPSQCDL